MTDSLNQKQINKQIQSGTAEMHRLNAVIKELEEHLSTRKGEVELEISELDTSIANKKDTAEALRSTLDSKTTKIAETEEIISELKKQISIREESLASVNIEIVNDQKELEEFKSILQKTRDTITKEKEEATKEMDEEKAVIQASIEAKKEELERLETQLAKIKFITDNAEKALEEVSLRNSEAEKEEKMLRNKIASHRSEIDELINERVDVVSGLKKANDEFESNKTRQAKAEEDRIKAEEELEVVTKKLLGSSERFSTMEMQLNSRAENLKQAYLNAGIEWPNL